MQGCWVSFDKHKGSGRGGGDCWGWSEGESERQIEGITEKQNLSM